MRVILRYSLKKECYLIVFAISSLVSLFIAFPFFFSFLGHLPFPRSPTSSANKNFATCIARNLISPRLKDEAFQLSNVMGYLTKREGRANTLVAQFGFPKLLPLTLLSLTSDNLSLSSVEFFVLLRIKNLVFSVDNMGEAEGNWTGSLNRNHEDWHFRTLY